MSTDESVRAVVADKLVDGSNNGSGTVSTWQGVALAVTNELVPGALAFVSLGATALLAIRGQTVPEVLSNIDFAIIAFYFGVRGRGAVSILRR